jgi:hypothetical protein
MRPIFTIHAGEYLVATKIEESFPSLRVWVPSKDSGIDLLVTDARQKKLASLQVKFSKDYLGTVVRATVTSEIESGGWWTLNRKKLAASPANYWVMVLYQFHSRKFDFVVVPPEALLSRYNEIVGRPETIQSYLWVTKQGRCWETRGLAATDLDKVSTGKYKSKARDFTQYLNVWPFKAAA